MFLEIFQNLENIITKLDIFVPFLIFILQIKNQLTNIYSVI